MLQDTMKTDIIVGLPPNALCFFKDSETDLWHCVFGDFKDNKNSPIGRGTTFDLALANLKITMKKWHNEGRER